MSTLIFFRVSHYRTERIESLSYPGTGDSYFLEYYLFHMVMSRSVGLQMFIFYINQYYRHGRYCRVTRHGRATATRVFPRMSADCSEQWGQPNERGLIHLRFNSAVRLRSSPTCHDDNNFTPPN